MLGNRMKFAFLSLAAFALIVFSGCILSPDEEAPDKPPVITYKPLTEKENLIYNLLQCYKDRNITEYEKLLHGDFLWYNQAGSATEYNLRTDDVRMTRGLFEAAKNTYPNQDLWIDRLDLWIASPGNWTQVPDIAGTPCADCWETTRDYQITAVMNGGDKTLVGNDLIKLYAIGIDEGGTKIYKFLRMDDILQN